MNCTKCGSENTQSYQMAFEGGFSVIDAKTRGVGVGAGIGSGGALGAGAATTKGTSQTAMSRRTAPPGKRRYAPALIGTFIAYLAVVVVFGLGRGIVANVVGYIFFGLAAFFAYKTFEHNKKVYPAQYQEWLNKAICLRCGHSFEMP